MNEQYNNMIQELGTVVIPAEDITVTLPYGDFCILLDSSSMDDALFYYHGDHLSSTAVVTDAYANVVQAVLYAPFGEVISEYNSYWHNGLVPDYMFNGKELDEESGMYYYSARYYAPPTFISRDPHFESYPTISPYAYTANNPVRYIDPTGMDIINGYESALKGTREWKNNTREAMRELRHDKKSAEYQQAKADYKTASKAHREAKSNYSTVQNAISDLQTNNNSLYNYLNDDLTDENGNRVDVYVMLNSGLTSQGRDGQVIENQRGGVFYHFSSNLACLNCVVMELNPTADDLGKVSSHEGGHIKYDIPNFSSYHKWQKNSGFNYKGYSGHGTNSKGEYDPSGQEADEQERIYRNKKGF